MTQDASFQVEIQQSSKSLVQLDEPQVHYLLLDILPGEQMPVVHPPVCLAIVFDRSTSMKGPHLDQMRSAVLALLEDLRPEDRVSVVAFSDQAEVILTPDQARDPTVARARLRLVKPRGGTEIGQGLIAGMEEIHRNYSQDGVNHIILLTDGHTYGDKELCMELASQAAKQDITINSVGIGADWSDRLLKDLATKTGGQITFLSAPKAVTDLLHTIHKGMVIRHVQINGSFGEKIDLRSAFRLQPEPVMLDNRFPLKLGHLHSEGEMRLLLELIVQPTMKQHKVTLAHFIVSGNLPGQGREASNVSIEIILPIADEPDPNPRPDGIDAALNLVSFYRTQEKARREAGLGQVSLATRRLRNLATHLRASGERELAMAALNEAVLLSPSTAKGGSRSWDPDGRQLVKFMFMRKMSSDKLRELGDLELYFSREDLGKLIGFSEEMFSEAQFFSFALISLDKFLTFINRYGQDAGEQILEKLTALFGSFSEKRAIVLQCHSDEYCMAAEINSLGGAKILAERMRKEARKVSVVDVEGRSTHPLSITIGLAFYPDHGSTLEALFQTANFALFVGKSRGGDCVVPP